MGAGQDSAWKQSPQPSCELPLSVLGRAVAGYVGWRNVSVCRVRVGANERCSEMHDPRGRRGPIAESEGLIWLAGPEGIPPFCWKGRWRSPFWDGCFCADADWHWRWPASVSRSSSRTSAFLALAETWVLVQLRAITAGLGPLHVLGIFLLVLRMQGGRSCLHDPRHFACRGRADVVRELLRASHARACTEHNICAAYVYYMCKKSK
jgi:hypothetical protein